MDYYLTDKIVLRNDRLFYEDKPIKNHNWHLLLSDYGWKKLPKKLITLLNKQLNKPVKNSLFGCLDCGSEGDCLFHCIGYAFKNVESDEIDSDDIRNILSNKITEKEYEEIIMIYRVLQDTGDFEEHWNPYDVSYEMFTKEILLDKSLYWGDINLLSMIKKYLDINILVFYTNELEDKHYYYPLMESYNESLKTVILLYENELHFTLMGYFRDGNMITLFTDKTLPYEIEKIIK